MIDMDTGVFMLNLRYVFGHRELDDWRDEQTLLAAKALNEAVATLIAEVEQELKGATLKDCLITPEAFIRNKISPRVKDRAPRLANMIVDNANAQLGKIAAYQAILTRQPDTIEGQSSSFQSTRDLAVAAGPVAGGVAVAMALPGAAITTTGGLLGTGLFATTVVAWPVVAIGGAVAGAALLIGGFNASRIRSKAEARLRRNAAAYVSAVLIRNDEKSPAILQQLAALFAETAREARKFR